MTTYCTAVSGRCDCGCWATPGLGRGVVCGARRGTTTSVCPLLLGHDGEHEYREG